MSNTTRSMGLGARVDEHAAQQLRGRLKDGLARSGMTITQAAKKSGLGRTTVSQALNSTDQVPSASSVVELAKVFRLDAQSLLELRRTAAVGELAAPLGPGRLISECDPLDLEVHPAGQGRDAARALPRYVRRKHDEALAEVVVTAVSGHSGMAVLVGTSSTGKTRACWEAVQPLAAAGWR